LQNRSNNTIQNTGFIITYCFYWREPFNQLNPAKKVRHITCLFDRNRWVRLRNRSNDTIQNAGSSRIYCFLLVEVIQSAKSPKRVRHITYLFDRNQWIRLRNGSNNIIQNAESIITYCFYWLDLFNQSNHIKQVRHLTCSFDRNQCIHQKSSEYHCATHARARLLKIDTSPAKPGSRLICPPGEPRLDYRLAQQLQTTKQYPFPTSTGR